MNIPRSVLLLALCFAPFSVLGQRPCTEAEGESLLLSANQRLQTLFGATVPAPRLRLYRQAEDLRRLQGTAPDSRGAGLYRESEQEIHAACREGDEPVFEPVLRHEAAHHYTRQVFGRLPPWLEEGVAAYLEAGPLGEGSQTAHIHGERLAEFRALLRRGELPALRDKFSRDGWNEPSSADYALGWALVFALLHHADADIQARRRQALGTLLMRAGTDGAGAYRAFLSALSSEDGAVPEYRWRREIWQLPH